MIRRVVHPYVLSAALIQSATAGVTVSQEGIWTVFQLPGRIRLMLTTRKDAGGYCQAVPESGPIRDFIASVNVGDIAADWGL